MIKALLMAGGVLLLIAAGSWWIDGRILKIWRRTGEVRGIHKLISLCLTLAIVFGILIVIGTLMPSY